MIVTNVGRIEHVNVANKELILAATAARQKYSAYLDELHLDLFTVMQLH